MRIELKLLDVSKIRVEKREYDRNLDDIRSVLIDICRAAEDHSLFIVSGFGQDYWPVDVGTDLVVFLEQLPEVIHSVTEKISGELDFYEQGVERKIIFSPKKTHYNLMCISSTDWQPNPKNETIKQNDFKNMLIKIKSEFILLTQEVAPWLLKNDWLISWIKNCSSRRLSTALAACVLSTCSLASASVFSIARAPRSRVACSTTVTRQN